MLGHQRVLDTLREAIKKNNVSHAYIFEGPDGIGRRETALSFSSMLLCQEDWPCGQCKSCQLFLNQSHPDFQEIYSEEKNIGVEDIRNILKALSIKPLYSKYKVFIINDADSMTVQAQNALLKSLEEPPSYVVFVLTVQSSAAITQTVRSRCQRILFNRLTDEEVYGILESDFGSKRSDWDFIVSYSDGVIGTAIDLVNSPQNLQLREDILQAAEQLVLAPDADIFGMYDIFEKNSDKIDYILRVMLLFFRDILMYKETTDYSILINSDKKDMIIRNNSIRLCGLIDCIKAIWNTKKVLEANVNFQLAIEVMLMKIQHICVKQKGI